jgi:hypothetical protein
MRRLSLLIALIIIGLFLCSSVIFGQDSLNVRRLAEIAHSNWAIYAKDVALSGNRAYICSYYYGLSIADISRPDTLIDLGHFYPPC